MAKKKSGLDPMDYAIGGGILIMLGSMLFKSKGLTREQAFSIIKQAGHGTIDTWGTDYVVAWATALQKGANQFSLNGKAYSSLTGRAV